MVDLARYKEKTGKIIGCAMQVHNALGSGFQEFIYQRALEIEFQENSLVFEREKDVPIFYKEKQIGFRRVDFLVEENILVELKAVSALTDLHITQTINYLEAFQLQVGLLINFGEKKLQFKRFLKDIKQ